ncbi:succinyldiaminopimelate transaminase [Helicobacter apodemus]|uniref:Succinyldiaminopimelate transaminase n=1 Tax=Helicobacter apodemus TaxID=135569 RepID=A0A4U8UH81_9HELI|nr:succinyldiaminopimelate transaminase [Helicobacter apodemus]TLE17263.1 succinyldiaminopimelate transaminase [Helicobacter apodemus]
MDFQPYPFEKLNTLIQSISTTGQRISLSVGEPQFKTPDFITKALGDNAPLLNKYPKTGGEESLKVALQGFIHKRFNVNLRLEEIVPSFGTREVLFNFPQFYLFGKDSKVIAHPNPFYQIYEGAAIASGAKTIYMNLLEENAFKPQLTKEQMQECDLVILNFPNNPTGSSLTLEELKLWVQWALEYDFLILNDECYSEIYTGLKPSSILEASIAVGNTSFKNVLALNSISKRSSAPGLRSGFIAGDSAVLKDYARYRTYVGCASPLPLQEAAALAWSDEAHTQYFQRQYAKNLKLAEEILGVEVPKETFYVWLYVGDDLAFSKKLLEKENILVLPGSFLSRVDRGINPGSGYVRLALVYEEEIIRESLLRIKQCL